MKKTIISLSALTIAVALTTSFTSCSNEDLTVESAVQPAEQTYTLSIPATLDNGTRAVNLDNGDAKSGTSSSSVTFTDKEEIHVYNATKKKMLTGCLTPKNIGTDGKTCELTGKLTGKINAGDELKLFYNMNILDDEYPENAGFIYEEQDATQASLIDGAEATVTASSIKDGVLKTADAASFELVQSMFRFNFVDENDKPVNIKTFRIQSKTNSLVLYYFPLETERFKNQPMEYAYTFDKTISGVFYMAVRFNESKSSDKDQLTFIITDEEGYEYKVTKKAPKGGFKNGKYYYNKSAFKLEKTSNRVPNIEWIKVELGKIVYPNDHNCYYANGEEDENSSKLPAEFSLSGISNGFCFQLQHGATIHLNGLDATYENGNNNQFVNSVSVLNLDINGENRVTCSTHSNAFSASGDVKLSGNGTLAVTSYSAESCGIYGGYNYKNTNNNYEITTELDVTSQLAAEGYTVTRSARQDNADGSYTWTYTVKPKV